MTETYPDVQLLIDGKWRPGASGQTIPVINPATEEVIGQVAHADIADLDLALAAAKRGFAVWRNVSAFERGKILRRAGELLRERAEHVALLMTREQGKPLTEARVEVMAAADTLDWFGEEARRAYGRIVPARAPNVTNLVMKEPVGPVAAFAPWNFSAQSDGPQTRRGACGGLFDHRESAGRDASVASGIDPRRHRCGRAGWRRQSRLRCAGGNLRTSHST